MLVSIGSTAVNTDHIVSITPAYGPQREYCWKVTLSNGETLTVNHDPGDVGGPIVPAPAGLVLVEAFLPSERHSFAEPRYRETVVLAFRVVAMAAPIPIGLLGEPGSALDRDYAVIQPDGQCVGWEQIWPDLAAFKAVCEERAAARPPKVPPAGEQPRSAA